MGGQIIVRGGAQTAQQPQGERGDKGWRDAGMLAG